MLMMPKRVMIKKKMAQVPCLMRTAMSMVV